MKLISTFLNSKLTRLNLKGVRSQAGDTIVEVLIALAIISFTLMGAYLMTRASTSTLQDTQEHHQAGLVADSQIEYLRDQGQTPMPSNLHCFASGGIPVATDASQPSDCSFDRNGNSGCALASDTIFCYDVKIVQSAASIVLSDRTAVPTTNYDVNVTWNGIKGQNQTSTHYKQSLALNAVKNTASVISGGGRDCSKGCTWNPNPKYFFNAQLTLQTSVPDALITGCTWYWGDGTSTDITSNAQCVNGQKSPTHDYKPSFNLASLPPAPLACPAGWWPGATGVGNKQFVIYVVVRTSTTSVQSVSHTTHKPYCG